MTSARDLLTCDVEHGVLIPLKTNLELRDDYATGNILITRVPTKSVANTIEYAHPTCADSKRFTSVLTIPSQVASHHAT